MSGRTPDEGRYSKVSRRMWDDERFRQLSKPKPNAQTLWKRLLTGPELGCIPGLFAARQGGLADALEWPVSALRKCWLEIERLGMAHADWSAGLVWVPNAIVHNQPQSTNAIIGWRLALRELPECPLKRVAIVAIREHAAALGEPWLEAFETALGEPSAKPSVMASPKPYAKPRSMASETTSRIQEQESGVRQKISPAAAADPKDLTGDRPAAVLAPEATATAPDSGVISPNNLAEAQAMPVCVRALWLKENPSAAQWVLPQQWPEVLAVAKALAEATGKPGYEQLGWYESDRGVRAIVDLYALGHMPSVLTEAVRATVKSAWWNQAGASRGLSSFTPEVLRRHLTGSSGTGVVPARRNGPLQESHGLTGFEGVEEGAAQ